MPKKNNCDSCKGGGSKKVSVPEVVIQKEWEKLKKSTEVTTKPPQVSLESDSFEDVYAWGQWVSQKGNITPDKSKKLIEETREFLKSKR